MAQDPALEYPPTPSELQGKPGDVPHGVSTFRDENDPADEIDKKYWEQCLSDAERAEGDWRSRGRDIIKIYRNDGSNISQGKKKVAAQQTFNILYSNTEVMQPAI